MKIFNPHARTSRKLHKDAYKYHETLKNSKYQQRILNVEQSSFCPLIFGCTGGAAPTATRTMQRLAEKLCEKRQSYPESINYIRTKISFALLDQTHAGPKKNLRTIHPSEQLDELYLLLKQLKKRPPRRLSRSLLRQIKRKKSKTEIGDDNFAIT